MIVLLAIGEIVVSHISSTTTNDEGQTLPQSKCEGIDADNQYSQKRSCGGSSSSRVSLGRLRNRQSSSGTSSGDEGASDEEESPTILSSGRNGCGGGRRRSRIRSEFIKRHGACSIRNRKTMKEESTAMAIATRS